MITSVEILPSTADIISLEITAPYAAAYEISAFAMDVLISDVEHGAEHMTFRLLGTLADFKFLLDQPFSHKHTRELIETIDDALATSHPESMG